VGGGGSVVENGDLEGRGDREISGGDDVNH